EFKKTGCAGEGSNGLLVFFETPKTREDPKFKTFARSIIQQENEDRMAIYRRILATNEHFGENDLPKIQKLSASLNRDNARPGDKIQLDDGRWIQKR
nr:YdbL family protein [Nitrospinaceae bacterium]NIR55686.1 YdbL family protein [Nitrospinaceae bacterium]NIS86130.1 YdbL family protein [Nitrospinaceae bacterium]NIT82974.1 YdbL family protein [Nitrospinaceae bacterium]NIU45177.1 YdbL family protein [Nitrospinaceae bacterium]